MGEHSTTVKSTADLTPAGILGYAKGIAATLSAILIAVVEFLPEGDYKRWAQIAIAVLGAIATIVVPNKVQEVEVTEPVIPPPVTPPPPAPAL